MSAGTRLVFFFKFFACWPTTIQCIALAKRGECMIKIYHKRRHLLAWCTASVLGLASVASSVMAEDHLSYAGVNLSGAEFNPKKTPGNLNTDYRYPSDGDYTYFAKKGMNIVRLPFLWERLQPSLDGPLDEDQLNLIRKAVETAKYNGQHIILDVHNYGYYNGNLIGSEQVPVTSFVKFWKKLAHAFKNDDAVIFGLMNEPKDITADKWLYAAQKAIYAIRRTGAQNLVLVPGTSYTGAHSWFQNYNGGPSNAQAFERFRDPGDHMAVEVHQYLDNDFSGTNGECINPNVATEKLSAFTNWLHQQGKVGFLGEFAGGNNQTCNQALENMLNHIEQNKDVWVGWTWWAAGAWWKDDYPFNIQPNNSGSEKPQISILAPHSRAITR